MLLTGAALALWLMSIVAPWTIQRDRWGIRLRAGCLSLRQEQMSGELPNWLSYPYGPSGFMPACAPDLPESYGMRWPAFERKDLGQQRDLRLSAAAMHVPAPNFVRILVTAELPCWLLVLLPGMPTLALWFLDRRRRWLRLRLVAQGVPICLHCGYDLTGNSSGRCPECGDAIPAPTPHGDPPT